MASYYYSPFRAEYTVRKDDSCPFCDTKKIKSEGVHREDDTLVENDHYFWMVNWYPKVEGHTMIIPKRHITFIDDESSREVVARNDLFRYASRVVQKAFAGAGIEMFMQFGEGSSSSQRHLHWHVLPARKDDRLVSLEKSDHFYATKKDEEKILMYPVEITVARESLQKLLRETMEKNKNDL